MRHEFHITFPGGVTTLSPNIYIGKTQLGKKPFLLLANFYSSNDSLLDLNATGLAYSESMGSPYVYLDVSKDNDHVLTSPQIRLKEPAYRGDFALVPWKVNGAFHAEEKYFNRIFLTGRGPQDRFSWTIVGWSENGS